MNSCATAVDHSFNFSCHPGLKCFTQCCRRLTLPIYPYDVVRLRRALAISSGEFLQRHVQLESGHNPFFPSLKLNMLAEAPYNCPFLAESGCQVYQDRPTSCRCYPLERTVSHQAEGRTLRQDYALVRHDYCLGHIQHREIPLRDWEREQGLSEYNVQNDCWAETDAFFATNPWQGEGKAGPRQQLAFMACYNIDAFHVYVHQHRVLERACLSREQRRRILRSDENFLRFALQWVRHAFSDGGSFAT